MVAALRQDEDLEVDAEGARVRRIKPFNADKDVDACTVYVVGRSLPLPTPDGP